MKADILGGMVPQDAEMFRSREYAPPPGMTWESVQELCKKILVVIPFRAGTGIQEGLCSHWGFWGNLGLKCADVKDPHGGFIEAVRAGMVRLFLDYVKIRPEIEYLVMIDNDEAIEWDAPIRIARHGVQVCTGVVCGANDEKGIFGRAKTSVSRMLVRSSGSSGTRISRSMRFTISTWGFAGRRTRSTPTSRPRIGM